MHCISTPPSQANAQYIQIPTSFSPAAIERFRYHAPLVHHIHLYDHQALFKWEGLSSLHVLNFPLTPQLRTIEICKWPTSARAVQDLEWVRFLTSPFTTSLRVTSHSKEAMQIWTSDDCYEALKIVEQRGARLLDLSIFANRTNKEKIDTKEKKDTQGRAVFARLYDAERLIERWTTITCLSVSVYQVDLKSLELFGSMHLRSLHIQGFGSSSQNWGTISACNAPFADLTELKVHNFLPQDVLALLSCHALIDGVLSLSLSYASISSITTPVINCMQRIAASSLGLTEFSVEFHVPVYNSLVNWLSQLVGLPLRRLLVRGCYISMFTFTETVPQWLSLQSLNLPGHTTTVECFGVFASCPNLHYVELYNVDSGRVPALLPNAGQDLVVRAEFTLGRMTKRELKTLAR